MSPSAFGQKIQGAVVSQVCDQNPKRFDDSIHLSRTAPPEYCARFSR
jgi:hypothetical protein